VDESKQFEDRSGQITVQTVSRRQRTMIPHQYHH